MKQKGSVSIAITVLGLLALVIGTAVFNFISAYNEGNRFEVALAARDEGRQNVLSNYTTKVGEAAQIPEMQRDDLKDVIKTALDARYGSDGSKAVFQMIKEQNPSIDSSVYTKLQQIIEAGRDDFKLSQDQLIDVKSKYNLRLGNLWSGFWLKRAGYPKVDLDKYAIIVDAGVRQKFESKTDAPIKLRAQ